jgi:hypothetical protein
MNGRILVVKNDNSTSTKFFDLDLIESMNELNTTKGIDAFMYIYAKFRLNFVVFYFSLTMN